MSFVEPFALLLLLPAAALAAWLALTPHAGSLALPGHWHRVIEAGMQRFMAAQVLSRNRVPWLFWLVTWTLIVLGLARPVSTRVHRKIWGIWQAGLSRST